ncbi:MAG TPA: response regulator, partial [Candidatus Limnocylindrales bacterium]
GAARRRAGAAAARLWVAAAGTTLFALAILAAGAGTAGSGAQAASGVIARVTVLVAALGYLVAFLPPAPLRRAFQAQTAYGGLRELLDAATNDGEGIWRRFLSIAIAASGARAALVIIGHGQAEHGQAEHGQAERRIGMVAGLDAGLVGRPIPVSATPSPEGELTIDGLAAIAGLAVPAQAGRALGARYAQLITLGTGVAAPQLLLLSTHPSLFGEDDRQLLAALGQQAGTLVEHRTALATQERLSVQLGQTVEALRRASEAKSNFLASMSHELRTPLNAIIGFSDLMRREEVDAEGNVRVPLEWVEHIRRGGAHLVELVNDVLDLSKIEAGRLELDREAIEVLPAVTESVAGLRPLATRKSQAIELSIPAGERILADRGRLRQIVYNLLSNAIKFTPEGGLIRIEGVRSESEFRLSVIDTGVGIALADQAAVFEEFRQVGSAAQRSEGTGLGLALTRRLVEAHDGRMELESAPGSGSRFTAIFPSALPAAEAPDSVEERPSPAPGRGAHDRPEAVLVIEDDPSAVRLLRAYLEPEGYRVQVAADGEHGLDDARSRPPAAILLDVLLPGIDGWEVLRRLKADRELRDIPVVIITVVDEKDVGLALGAVDYLVKPIDRDALLATLGRLTLTTKVRQRTVRILAVDDEAAALDALEATLTLAGFDVIRADGGRSGVELARRLRPDLVICDLVMPDLDGFGVVGELKSDPLTAEIPIVILTAHDLSASDKSRLNGKVLRIVSKGADAQAGLRAWLVRTDANLA